MKYQIDDNQQIGNIVVLVKEHLNETGTYSVKKHKEEVRKELTERGYAGEIIEEWVGYIK